MNNNLEEINMIFKVNNLYNKNQFEIYQSYFPDLELEVFNTLKGNGMLGRLFRGQEINLIHENLNIPFCLWRNAVFIKTNQFAPSVIKKDNPYW